MKAAVFRRPGEPADVLAIEDIAMPVPGPGQVLVRMLASPVNPADLLIVRGRHLTKPAFPASPGVEGVGVVEKSGGGFLANRLVGKRVATIGVGAWRQFHVVEAKQAIPVPASLSDEQAAMYFVNPATARLLTEGLPRGAWLVQSAGASAVGRLVVRLGKLEGFRTFSVVRRPEQAEELRKLGADVVALETDDVPAAFAQASGGAQAVRALDPVGGAVFGHLCECLAPGGLMRVYGSLSAAPAALPTRGMVNNVWRVEGFQLKRAMDAKNLLGKLAVLRRLGRMAAAGLMDTPLAATFPLEDVHAALQAAEAPGRNGKVILRIGTR